MTKTEIL